MNVATFHFPSVFETAFGTLENTAKDLIGGLKIKKDNTWYMVGNLAKKNGVNASRITNAAPSEEDFDILFRAALISLSGRVQQPMTITIGFPFASYQAYRQQAEQFLGKRHFMLEYDSQTYHVKGQVKKETFDIDRFEVIPEIVGGIIGLRKIASNVPKNFLAISFGFGTLEGILVTEEGLVHRTSFSTHGLRYAVNNLATELGRKHFLELKNEHQMDEAFIKGSLVANRKRIDFTDIRKEVLVQYYRKVVSPAIRSHLTDSDLEVCEKIYLFGGGAYYTDLMGLVMEEFNELMNVEVLPEPEKVACTGYLYNSLRLSDNYPNKCAGIDLGNAYSVVSYFSDNLLNPDFKS